MKAKRFLSTVLSICLAVLTLFSFVGCGEKTESELSNDDLSKRVEMRESEIERLQEEIKQLTNELTATLEALEKVLEETDEPESDPDLGADYEEIKRLQNELKQREEVILALQEELKAAQEEKYDPSNEWNTNEDWVYWRDAPYGVFCSLEFAYMQDWLTQNDLKSIAYYFNGGREGNESIIQEGFKAQERGELAEDTARKIRETIAFSYRKSERNSYENATEKDVEIDGYYGCYDGMYAVMTSDSFSMYDCACWEVDVGGVKFYYGSGNRIRVYIENTDIRKYTVKNVDHVWAYTKKTSESTVPVVDGEFQRIVSTYAELQSLLEEYLFIDRNLFSHYDEAYFEYYSLVICSTACSRRGGQYLNSISYKRWGELWIHLSYQLGEEKTKTHIVSVFSFKKEDLGTVSAINLDIKYV